ncbi:MAG: hypothetical protein PVG20_04305 [Thioalkalispiraceae bacterium]|jgi:hypothetical protein
MRSFDLISEQQRCFQPHVKTRSMNASPCNENIVVTFLATSARYFELPVKAVARNYQDFRRLNLLGNYLTNEG